MCGRPSRSFRLRRIPRRIPTPPTDCHPGSDDRRTRGTLAHAETPPDFEKCHSGFVQTHRLRRIGIADRQRRAKRHRTTNEVSGDGALVDAELLRDLRERQSAKVEIYDLVDLRLGEKSLSSPNRPHDPASIVHNRRLSRSPVGLVDAPHPPRHNGFQGRGKILQLSTEAHMRRPRIPRAFVVSRALRRLSSPRP